MQSYRMSVRSGRVLPLLSKHPWVFADSVMSVEGEPAPGAIVRVDAPDGTFLGWGLFSPYSAILARIYSFNESEPIEPGLFHRRILNAWEYRKSMGLPSDTTNVFRAIYAEGDFLPGVVADYYNGVVAVTFTTAASHAYADVILDAIEGVIHPAGILGVPDPSACKKEKFEHPTGTLRGTVPEVLEVKENGISYRLRPSDTQRKLLYSDQRVNRSHVAGMARGEMLDLYCYHGGFALNALAAGSVERAVCIDSSSPAIEHLTANAELNGCPDRIDARVQPAEEAMVEISRSSRRFDVVVMDPPRLVPDRRDLERGMRKYAHLNELAFGCVAPGGLLVSCSCSGLLPRADFLRAISVAAGRAGREVSLVEMCSASPCHPVNPFCPETEYLKVAFLRLRG